MRTSQTIRRPLVPIHAVALSIDARFFIFFKLACVTLNGGIKCSMIFSSALTVLIGHKYPVGGAFAVNRVVTHLNIFNIVNFPWTPVVNRAPDWRLTDTRDYAPFDRG